MLLGEPQIILRLEDELAGAFENDVTILKTDRDLIQIMHPEVSKAVALAKVAKWYGVPMEQVMAIGDAPNDVGMLQAAGVCHRDGQRARAGERRRRLGRAFQQ